MKKSLIALAVAGAMTAPIVAQADATLYGNVEVEAIFGDNFATGEGADADLEVDDAIIGVKGASDLENLEGVQAYYQMEVEFNRNADPFGSTDTGSVVTRKALVGLESDFGYLIFGRQNNLANAAEVMDKYAESFSTNNYFAVVDRLGNAASYVTPKFAGFEAYGQIVVDGEGDDARDDVDGGTVGFNYNLGGFGASVSYMEWDDGLGDTNEVSTVGLGYSIADLTLEGQYQNAENNSTNIDSDMWGVGAAYALGNAKIGATYMDFEIDDLDVESDEWGVYASYALGKKASVKAQYTSADVDGDSGDYDKFVVGYNVSF
ncbi:porin [Marinobacterium aestuariivivens]|uniref:Porin n=1 Tax=Marinobacterium aestuariivivens TaxID=1698799 RepID=A0ABW1ZU76_9GAMM